MAACRAITANGFKFRQKSAFRMGACRPHIKRHFNLARNNCRSIWKNLNLANRCHKMLVFIAGDIACQAIYRPNDIRRRDKRILPIIHRRCAAVTSLALYRNTIAVNPWYRSYDSNIMALCFQKFCLFDMKLETGQNLVSIRSHFSTAKIGAANTGDLTC